MAIIENKQSVEHDSQATSTPLEPSPPAYIDSEPGLDAKLRPVPAMAPPAPTSAATSPSSSASASDGDSVLKSKLEALERKLSEYAQNSRSRSRSHSQSRDAEEAAILSSMRDLSTSHPDPDVQRYWAQRADAFENAADEKDKLKIVKDVVKAMAVILAAPLAIIGMLLIGTGQLVKASGDLISGGAVSNLRKKSKTAVPPSSSPAL
ncbi:hypothetical protein MKEN_00041500 [Mycena kentingensis (nom. inval.)]|nr:hypothetical protein MKEN_00041500 [Mycena kentingensis (nom. inval.)]